MEDGATQKHSELRHRVLLTGSRALSIHWTDLASWFYQLDFDNCTFLVTFQFATAGLVLEEGWKSDSGPRNHTKQFQATRNGYSFIGVISGPFVHFVDRMSF